MLTVVSSAIPLPKISFTPQESKILQFIKDVCLNIPALSNGKISTVVARCAGGFVRDKLLGIPSKDIDISVDTITGAEFSNFILEHDLQNGTRAVSRITTTEGRPEQIKNLAVAFLKIYGQEIEILGLRTETYQPGNRNPSIQAGNARDDAFRRDLTINSLFYNINTGQVEDFTGMGIKDLSTMTLRTPIDPVKTFTEDPLRLLRVLRFYSRYENSQIAPEVLEAMRNDDVQHQVVRKIHKPDETFGIVVERTSEELRKIMKGGQPHKAVQVMYDVGLLSKMLNLPPSFHPLNMDQNTPHHEMNVIDHTTEVIRNMNIIAKQYNLSDDERCMMNVAALFHDLGKLDPRSHKARESGQTSYSGREGDGIAHEHSSSIVWSSFAKAMKMNNKEQDFIKKVVLHHMDPHSHINDEGQIRATDAQLRKFKDQNPLWKFFYLHAMADSFSKQKDQERLPVSGYESAINQIDQIQLPVLLSGQEIMKITGLGPGAKVGEIMREIRRLQYNNFGRKENLSFEQLKSLAIEVARKHRRNILNGLEIKEVATRMLGRPIPDRPPPGRPGYIAILQELLKDELDRNPNMDRNTAIQILEQQIQSGILAPYLV